MRCPICNTTATETAPACLKCGFSIAALDQALGIPPSLKADVTDLAQEFRPKEIRRLQALLARLARRFPQMRFAVVAGRAPSNVTLPLYAFWLFNRGGLASAVEKGAANRIVLLVIDAEGKRAASILGYGLEPFVGQQCLASALESMLPHFAADEPADAVEAFFQSLATQLESIVQAASLVYGLQGEEFEDLRQLDEVEEAAALAY